MISIQGFAARKRDKISNTGPNRCRNPDSGYLNEWWAGPTVVGVAANPGVAWAVVASFEDPAEVVASLEAAWVADPWEVAMTVEAVAAAAAPDWVEQRLGRAGPGGDGRGQRVWAGQRSSPLPARR